MSIFSSVIFQSDGGNCYFFDHKINQWQFIHPILFHILELHLQGTDVTAWVKELQTDPIEIKGLGSFSRGRIEYYYRKFLLLQQGNYFRRISQEDIFQTDLKDEEIERMLANISQITFEVTEACQLKCMYCGYGTLYDNYEPRKNKPLCPQTAKNVIDYFSRFLNSPKNKSRDKSVYIGFYGGEPLLCFPFVEEIVSYIKEKTFLNNRFKFAITTNGLLIEKYMDFLVENNFNMLISLDGDEDGNSYRTFANGSPSFQQVLGNVQALRTRYPEYFEKYVNFNAVLHNRNSFPGVYRFFRDKFGKFPSIGSLNTLGIKDSQRENFVKAAPVPSRKENSGEEFAKIEKDMFLNLPTNNALTTFLHHSGQLAVKKYNDLVFPDIQAKKLPSGTCFPFSKKVFVTANGKILPCERIGHDFPLGTADSENVHLDVHSINQFYSMQYKKIYRQCLQCYGVGLCVQCIFYLNLKEDNPRCSEFKNAEDFSNSIKSYIDLLEKDPWKYAKLLKETIVED
jgi:uncharacterized protein